jgi:hypothetical protein
MELGNKHVEFEKNKLQNITRQFVIRQVTTNKRKERRTIATHQDIESLVIPRYNAPHQLAIRAFYRFLTTSM